MTAYVTHGEQIANKYFSNIGDVEIVVRRQANLSDDLRDIEDRRVQHIDLSIVYAGDGKTYHLNIENALWLRDALNLAIGSAEDVAPLADWEKELYAKDTDY